MRPPFLIPARPILAPLVRRFLVWRRTSGGWVYFCLVAAWCGLTAALGYGIGQSWALWVASASVFALVFEVGGFHLVAVAWRGQRRLEVEGEEMERRRRG